MYFPGGIFILLFNTIQLIIEFLNKNRLADVSE